MKALMTLLVLTMTSSAYAGDFFECGPLADTEEYRVGIDMSGKKAGFFDNDSTSIMKLKSVRSLESNPPQTILTYEGKDESAAGTLKLEFNHTKRKIMLYAISPKGKAHLVGRASCQLSDPWEL